MFSLPSFDVSALEHQLCLNREKLVRRIRERLHGSGDPTLMGLANEMSEVDDAEVADLLNDTEIAILSHDLSELQGIELALQRIANGTYGICTDCGRQIEPARLNVLPAVRQCLKCKTAFEKRRGIFSISALQA